VNAFRRARPKAPFRKAALGALILGLAACSGIIVAQSSNDRGIRPGILGTFTYAAAGHDVLVAITSNPFPGRIDGDVGRTVTEAMRGNTHGPSATFTTDPKGNVREGFAVVLAFDPGLTVTDRQLCRTWVGTGAQPQPQQDSSAPPVAEAASLHLLMVFCAGEEPLSWVTARRARPTSADDPAFRTMITHAARLLIPSRDDDPGDGPLVNALGFAAAF
jgi:hypothetical protein